MSKLNKYLTKYIFVPLFVALFCISAMSVFAEDEFAVNVQTINDRIYSDETAEFQIKISNLNPEERDYVITSPHVVDWDVRTSPRTDYIVTVPAGANKIVNLLASPINVFSGQYNVRVDIKSRSDPNIKRTRNLVIDLFPENDTRREYAPSLKTSVIIDEELDPRSRAVIKVKLQNLIPRELEGVIVRLSSKDTDVISDSINIDLGPREERTQVFLFELDPLQEPLSDSIKAEIKYFDENRNKTFIWYSEPVQFSITTYSTIAATDKEETGFLKTRNSYTFTNLGNVEKQHVFRLKLSGIEDMFTKFVPEDTKVIREDGARYRERIFTIGPNKAIEVVVVSNYRLLFYLALAVIIIIVLYYVLRSPILVKKSAVSLDKKEDGMSEVKIRIYIRNRSSKSYENVRIIDKIPHIATIGKEFQIGTLKPSEIIRHEKSATIVKWHLTHLEDFEERLITYKIKSRLTIIGGLRLPNCVLKYKAENHRTKSVYSNAVSLR